LPVFAGFYQFFRLSWQKYFLPWQKPNQCVTDHASVVSDRTNSRQLHLSLKLL